MELKNIISSLALALIYSTLTFVGVGIYYCGCTQSQQLTVLAIQTECQPCSSAAESCCSHGDPQQDRENDCGDDDCCLLAYQYVSVDQLYVTQQYNDHAKILTLFSLPFVGLASSVRESFFTTKIHSPPPNLLKISVIYLHRQLRL